MCYDNYRNEKIKEMDNIMIYLVLIALLVNMDSIVYFFEIPYQIVDMGGAQAVASTLNIMHAVIYVFASGVSSSKCKAKQDSMKQIKILMICISSIYVITCCVPYMNWLYILVSLHGLLIGVFWSIFWSAFYKKKAETDMKMSTLTISSAICSVIGPIVAGKIYSLSGKYVLLLFAGILFIMLFLEKPLSVFAKKWKERFGGNCSRCGDSKNNLREALDETYQIRPEAKPADGARMILMLWAGILFAGYLEGIFRSSMAIYLLAYDINSDVWGTLQSVKLLAQTLTLIGIRWIGENRFVFSKTKTRLLTGMLCFIAGTVLMRMTVSYSLMFLGMIFFGVGYGVIYFLCMTAGTSLTGLLDRNLNGIAECLTGAGILLGSMISGYMGGNPYRIYMWMILAGTVIMFLFFKNNVWVRTIKNN